MERRDEASAPRLLLSPSEPLMYVKAALDTLHYTCKVDLGLPPPGKERTLTFYFNPQWIYSFSGKGKF